MRKVALVAGMGTIFACALAQVQMQAYLEQEPNNSFSNPQIIVSPVSQSQGFVVWEAMLDPVRDRDFYRFQVVQAGTYSIRVDTNLDAVLRLYDAQGNVIAENDNFGNPDLPIAPLAPGLTHTLEVGVYVVEVFYYPRVLGRARYALRVFPGTTAPDYDPTEPNDTPEQAIYLGRLAGGEFITQDYRFLGYGTNDVDAYRFELDTTGLTLTIRTQTYMDTVIRVLTPDGRVLENDDSDWDVFNPAASQIQINLAPRGTYYVLVRAGIGWGGYYRLRVSAPLPDEVVLRDGDAEFRLRDLSGSPLRNPVNNADWAQGGTDHFYQIGWWYRVEGEHSRELTLSEFRFFEQHRPNRATLTYLEPNGIVLATHYELRRTREGGSVLYADLTVINFQFQTRTFQLFHFADPDLNGATLNQARWDDRRILVQHTPSGSSPTRLWIAALTPYTHWQVSQHPQLIDLLVDEAPTTLSDGSLPLDDDFTGAFQWTVTLAPFEFRTVRVHYALNTAFVPSPADIDRDGCVNDADLLTILYKFGAVALGDPADINGDGIINDGDLLEVLYQFGFGCQ